MLTIALWSLLAPSYERRQPVRLEKKSAARIAELSKALYVR